MIDHTSELEKQVKTLRKRSLFTLFLTWLALFFTVVGIAAGYKNFLRVHDKANEARTDAKAVQHLLPKLVQKDTVEAWQKDVTQQLQSSRAQSAAELKALKGVSETSSYVANTLNQQVQQLTLQQQIIQTPQRQARQWQIHEVRYLLSIATRKLQLDLDVEGAKQALKLADQLLIEIALVELLPVRQQVAKDIAALQDYVLPDTQRLVSHIDQLIVVLKPLMLSKATSPEGLASGEELLDGRNSMLSRVQERLSEAIVVRPYDQALAKQMSGDIQSVRYALLRLKLESLKLLALRQQRDAYRVQLTQIRHILQQEQPQLMTDSLVTWLNELDRFMMVPDQPKLRALKKLDETLSVPISFGTAVQ